MKKPSRLEKQDAALAAERKAQREAECIYYNPPNVGLSKDPSLPPLSVVVTDSWPGP